MITIQIEKTAFEIPGSWDEVTVEQYQQMVNHAGDMDPVRLLSILTKLDFEALNNCEIPGFIEQVVPVLLWIREPIELVKLPRKTHITIEGKTIPVIADPGTERIGQKLKLTKDIAAAEGTPNGMAVLIPKVVANYYAPHLKEDKKWDEKDVDRLEIACRQMKLVEAAPEANFFLLGYIKYSPGKKSGSMSSRQESKLKQV